MAAGARVGHDWKYPFLMAWIQVDGVGLNAATSFMYLNTHCLATICGKPGRRDSEDSLDTSGDIRELQAVRGGEVSIEDDVVVVGDASNNGHHGNTSVLALDSTTALEGLRFAIHPAKGIKNTEGLSSSSKLELIDVQGGGGLENRNKCKIKNSRLYSRTEVDHSISPCRIGQE
jgi:hypothetical protein